MKKKKFRELIENALEYSFDILPSSMQKINSNATIGLFETEEERDKWIDNLEKIVENSEEVQALLSFMIHPALQDELRLEDI